MSDAKRVRHIALVAHDNMKPKLLDWVREHRETLSAHTLYGTGTTGAMVEDDTGLPVHRFMSGPVGGDQQIGAKIAEGEIDMLVFLWDPLEAQPHDPDVKALLRIGTVWDIPIATNIASANLMMTSPLLDALVPESAPDDTGD